jgi:hypothetical protein
MAAPGIIKSTLLAATALRQSKRTFEGSDSQQLLDEGLYQRKDEAKMYAPPWLSAILDFIPSAPAAYDAPDIVQRILDGTYPVGHCKDIGRDIGSDTTAV